MNPVVDVRDWCWIGKMEYQRSNGLFVPTVEILESALHRVKIGATPAPVTNELILWMDTIGRENYCLWGDWILFKNPSDALHCRLAWGEYVGSR